MKRSDLLLVIEAALAAEQPSYARQAAQRYLAVSPGDLAMQFALARAWAAEGEPSLATGVLAALVAVDPEDFRAHRLLGDQWMAQNNLPAAADAWTCAHVGDGLGVPGELPGWAAAARAAYLAGRIGDWITARRESEAALNAAAGASLPLAALLRLCSFWHAGQLDHAQPLAQGFHARWPTVVAFHLCLAECLLAGDEQSRAVALLHDTAAQDAAGQVVARHWGTSHPYRSLWAADASASLPGPIPPPLATVLGLNHLPRPSSPPQSQVLERQASLASHHARQAGANWDAMADIRAQLEAVAAKLPSHATLKYRLWRMSRNAPTHRPAPVRHGTGTGSADRATAPSGRLPRGFGRSGAKGINRRPGARAARYVILSSRTRLQRAFGPDGLTAIDALVRALAANASSRTGMTAHVLYVDDAASLSPFGLRPVNPENAWDIKLLLANLAARLKEQKSSVGALLIVGGAEIIPFHHLPNPTDDADPDIPSDNPYATSDENYFVPEWPVGRIPSGAGKDVGPLLCALETVATSAEDDQARRTRAGGRGWIARVRTWCRRWWTMRSTRRSFGYSASIWKDASAVVYNLIGNPRDMLTSPPVDASALPREGLAPSRLSYFNLHGIEDGPEWFGQRGRGDALAGGPQDGLFEDYPVALRPGDVVDSGRAPVIVFAEACYGANILGKKTDDALCLRFLVSGSRVLVGSTKIAYGSLSPPLIGADLLGRLFWQNLNVGLPAGEALRRSKLQLAHEMHTRQGFLDGEDQKTLISFVLYGDPLATAPHGSGGRAVKQPPLARMSAPPPILCDKVDGPEPGGGASPAHQAQTDPSGLSPDEMAQIKTIVANYLPEMKDAQLRVAHSHADCAGQHHDCPTAQLSRSGKARPSQLPRRTRVVTLSKTIQTRTELHAHPHYARVTLDDRGKVVKLAVSR